MSQNTTCHCNYSNYDYDVIDYNNEKGRRLPCLICDSDNEPLLCSSTTQVPRLPSCYCSITGSQVKKNTKCKNAKYKNAQHNDSLNIKRCTCLHFLKVRFSVITYRSTYRTWWRNIRTLFRHWLFPSLYMHHTKYTSFCFEFLHSHKSLLNS